MCVHNLSYYAAIADIFLIKPMHQFQRIYMYSRLYLLQAPSFTIIVRNNQISNKKKDTCNTNYYTKPKLFLNLFLV